MKKRDLLIWHYGKKDIMLIFRINLFFIYINMFIHIINCSKSLSKILTLYEYRVDFIDN